MAYLKNLKRLISAKKVLRLFASKLGRLHKHPRSKTTRLKTKKHPSTSASKGTSSWLSTSLSFQSRFKRKRKEGVRYPRKKTKPVYVDQLFLDMNQASVPVVERVTGHVVQAGTSGKDCGRGADDMWESLVMGSPQMDGINERAEEFISRFRAGLLDQEITARRL